MSNPGRAALVFALALPAVAIVLFFFARSPEAPRSVVLATTTSAHDSGLLERLLPWFASRTGIRVDVVPLGTGQALDLAGRGGAGAVLVHSKDEELAFVAAGHGSHRVAVMANEFVLSGPPSDPAGVRGRASAADAFRAIADAGALFVSRADRSGTHARELALWREAGITPAGAQDLWYLEAGAGMGAVLRMAGERGAYVLADRATFEAKAAGLPGLAILVESRLELQNPYAAILAREAPRPARELVSFLVSPEGQALLGAIEKDGRPLFQPIARDLERASELGFPDQAGALAYYDAARAPETSPEPGAESPAAPALPGRAGPEVARIAGLTLGVSFAALALAAGPGLLLGVVLGVREFRGRGAILAVVNTSMGLPPILVGLVVYLALVGTGVLYTPAAMVLAQTVLVLPQLVGVVASSVSTRAAEVGERALSLGADPRQRLFTHLFEARRGVVASLVLGFGAAISEVGAVVLVGGNIRHRTQVLTGAILWRTELGDLETALALGGVLLAISLVVNAFLTHYQWKAPRR